MHAKCFVEESCWNFSLREITKVFFKVHNLTNEKSGYKISLYYSTLLLYKHKGYIKAENCQKN